MRPDRVISDYAFDELSSLSMLPGYKEDQRPTCVGIDYRGEVSICRQLELCTLTIKFMKRCPTNAEHKAIPIISCPLSWRSR
jgi:hypothetical protein